MHQHTLIELYVLFLLGAAMHVLKRLSMTKLGKLAYLKAYWLNLVVRVFLGALGYALWQANPQVIQAYLPAWAKDVLPTGHVSAMLLGYFLDSGLDLLASKVPGISGEIPALPDNGAPAKP